MDLLEHADHIKTKYDSSIFLGRLCWYSISETANTNHADFCASLIENFADCTIMPDLPPGIRPVDVFKRACSSAAHKNVPTLVEGVVLNYMVRPSGADEVEVCRTIVREELDKTGQSLNYDELVQIRFNRKTESLTFKWFHVPADPIHDLMATEMLANIKDYYDNESKMLTAYAIRLLTQKILERQVFAVKVRPSGGVYFVHEKFAAEVEALEATIDALPNASFHTLPLLDDGKQREMLRAAFEEESIGEIDRLMGEIAEIMKDGKKISIERYAKYKVEYEQNRKKVLDFSDILDDALEGTAIRLEMMSGMMYDLVGSVKDD